MIERKVQPLYIDKKDIKIAARLMADTTTAAIGFKWEEMGINQTIYLTPSDAEALILWLENYVETARRI